MSNLVCSDHPSNTDRVGVCLYYKNYLPPRALNIGYLKECPKFELFISVPVSRWVWNTLWQFWNDVRNSALKISLIMTVIGDFN